MNLPETIRTAKHAPAQGRRKACGRSGSAVLIVLVLLACLALFFVANSSVLHSLQQELKLIDQQQLKKYGTNSAARK